MWSCIVRVLSIKMLDNGSCMEDSLKQKNEVGSVALV